MQIIRKQLIQKTKERRRFRQKLKEMREQNTQQFIIMNNALQLSKINYKSQEGQRNLLNKWFQDSVKNYIFEQIASPLIAKYLKCTTSSEVRTLIHKNVDKSKPKYMSIIDQYFFYINKYNQREVFIEKLNNIIFHPLDISQQQSELSYSVERAIRKQLVCYLILRFFEVYGELEVPSFYELWNLCFPEEIQMKKRLTRFDKKDKTQASKIIISKESSSNSEFSTQSSTHLSYINQIHYTSQESSLTVQPSILLDTKIISSFDQSQVNFQESTQSVQKIAYSTEKKQINNGIIDEDDSEEDICIQSYTQKVNLSSSFQPLQESYCIQNEEKLEFQEKQEYLSSQQDQNEFFYQKHYYQQPFDNFQLNQTNYQINPTYYNLSLCQNYY
ncbi:hypothetical protein TTHERM_00607120 (macronuclear) [Tetrahymena thermophila SB210]|uniref:Uncharacterized protein n=1 Tax=Tetrahymena thermophila (strain SB210) TaxID=312017 RepID=Q22YH9_TETTS|nr:hypothetical protein TTHERM_00607120 [Tetrahymena thermophila SB210]EAR90306.1 hypothetical protein TTHERM_00607120 [Tetrahymena thermophila SB210]|eukprot:XP_001010551.1 hypothetical protein TTHERM_00607120 [Tetrahymena thermophila SB210]